MDNNIKIRLNKTDSIYSRNTNEYSNIDIKQTGNIVPNTTFNGFIDIDKVFRSERNDCTKYSLTLTINPYCTNVLFNMCTEIVYEEGSEFQMPILDSENCDNIFFSLQEPIYGKDQGVNRSDMIRNTEYSREKIGVFTYHPGMDIFNNHILRNKTNKIITYLNPASQTKPLFNTIRDYVRDFEGNTVTFAPRKDITSSPEQFIEKHQYIFDDIYPFISGESYNANISEDGGWVGFKNTTVIDAKDLNNEVMDISRVINNKNNCEFVDMYPDRSLFLFSPKYNEKRERLEYNWDIELTYPYKNFYDHPLVRDYKYVDGNYVFGNTYGLLLHYGKCATVIEKDNNRRMVFKFKSFIKHKLNRGVFLNVYYKINNHNQHDYEKYSDTIMVSSIGDDNRQNSDYYFNVLDDGLYNEIITKNCLELFYQPVAAPINPNDYVEYTHIPEIIPVFENDYYISYYEYIIDPNPLASYTEEQTFYEIPYDTLYTPAQICVTDGKIYTYYKKEKRYYKFLGNIQSNDDIKDIATNTFDECEYRIRRVVSEVESEYYFRIFRKIPNLKFAQELLNDDIVDNDKLFEQFVNENATYEDEHLRKIMHKFDSEWYDLAFAKTIYGDQITQVSYSDAVDIDKLIDNLGRPLTSIYATIIKKNDGHVDWYCDDDTCNYSLDSIEYSHCFGDVTSGVPFFYGKEDRSDDIRKLKGFLSDARSLRNTDNGYDTQALPRPKSLEYWYNNSEPINGILDNEFFGDIVDFNPVNGYEITLENVNFRFNTQQRESDESIGRLIMEGDELQSDDFDEAGFNVETIQYEDAIIHPEGYIYEPHYEIMVRELSDIQQDSHYKLNIGDCTPVSLNGMFLKIETTSLHKCDEGDTIFLCDDENSIWYETSVVYVPDVKTIIVNVISPDSENYISWIEACEKIRSGKIIVRRKNEEIPKYARRVSINDFIWRKINKVGDSNNEKLKEYPFTNGTFYVEKQINFFLKRQDPDGYNKLHNHSDFEIFGDADGLRKQYAENERTNNEGMVC